MIDAAVVLMTALRLHVQQSNIFHIVLCSLGLQALRFALRTEQACKTVTGTALIRGDRYHDYSITKNKLNCIPCWRMRVRERCRSKHRTRERLSIRLRR